MKTHMFIIINLLTTLMFFTSCKQDAEESFFFKIETGLLEWHVGAEGGQQEYIVESNAPWQIVHKGIGTWAKVSPRRSEGTGSFLITVKENESEEEPKSVLCHLLYNWQVRIILLILLLRRKAHLQNLCHR